MGVAQPLQLFQCRRHRHLTHARAVVLVFLARLNGFAAIAYVFAFSVLSIGGESAARRLGVPHFFTLVLMAIILILLAVVEYVDHKRRAAGKA